MRLPAGERDTAAKVGFFLAQHRQPLMVQEARFNVLREIYPRHPHYLVRGRPKGCRWGRGWNLMITAELLERSWAEVL